jgi:predicted ArsR family transcriptional regulator
LALISYDKIVEYTGLDRTAVRRGISFLFANGLVHVEQISSQQSEYGSANGYRLAHLEGRVNMATRNRRVDIAAVNELAGVLGSEPF